MNKKTESKISKSEIAILVKDLQMTKEDLTKFLKAEGYSDKEIKEFIKKGDYEEYDFADQQIDEYIENRNEPVPAMILNKANITGEEEWTDQLGEQRKIVEKEAPLVNKRIKDMLKDYNKIQMRRKIMSEEFGIKGMDSLVKIYNDAQWTLEESLRVIKLELESLKKENAELKNEVWKLKSMKTQLIVKGKKKTKKSTKKSTKKKPEEQDKKVRFYTAFYEDEDIKAKDSNEICLYSEMVKDNRKKYDGKPINIDDFVREYVLTYFEVDEKGEIISEKDDDQNYFLKTTGKSFDMVVDILAEIKKLYPKVDFGGNKISSSDSDSGDSQQKAMEIMEIFEEWLDKKDITIPDNDRTGKEEEARLYGEEYYKLEDFILNIVENESEYSIETQIKDILIRFDDIIIQNNPKMKKPSSDNKLKKDILEILEA